MISGPLDRISKRSVLRTVGVGVGTTVAGCTTEGGQHATTPPLLDETAAVKPGEYEAFEFELDAERWMSVSATLSDRSVDVKKDGPSLDVVIMTAQQFTQFQKEGQFEYVNGVSMPDVVTGRVSDEMKPGNYIALVDNTSKGSASPGSSDVTGVVDIQITTSKRRN
jgi:hypothetical protein